MRSPNGIQTESMFHDFFKWMLALTGAAWVLLALPLYAWGQPEMIWGTVVGCALPALCFTVGFYSVCRYFHMPMNKLMMVFLGGMLARLGFIGATFFLILWLTQLHVISFLASLLGFYILYLTLELYFVNNRFHRMKEG